MYNFKFRKKLSTIIVKKKNFKIFDILRIKKKL